MPKPTVKLMDCMLCLLLPVITLLETEVIPGLLGYLKIMR